MPWSSDIEKAIRTTKEKAHGYRILHEKSSRRAASIFFWLSVAGMLMGALGALVSGIGAILHPDEDIAFPLANVAMSTVNGLIAAVIKQSKLTNSEAAHSNSSRQYDILESNIYETSLLPEKPDGAQYFKDISKVFRSLKESSPVVPAGIFRAHVARWKEEGVALPGEYSMHRGKGKEKEGKDTKRRSHSMAGQEMLKYELERLNKH